MRYWYEDADFRAWSRSGPGPTLVYDELVNWENEMKRLFAVLALAVFLAGAIGCETVKGVGKDVEKAGEAIQKSTN